MDYWKFREIIVDALTFAKPKYISTFTNFFNRSGYGGFIEGRSNLVGNSLFNLKPTSTYSFNFGKTSYNGTWFSNYLSRPTYTMPSYTSLYSPTYTSPTLTAPTYQLPTWGKFNFLSARRTASTPIKLTNPMDNIKNLNDFKALGYNQAKGQELFNDAYRHMDGHWGQHDCKKHVREASERCGLGTISGGNGVKSLASLRRNPNYKEVPASSIDVNNIPAGTIGIFKPGSQGYSRTDGHTEIYGYVNGKLKGISNGVTNNVKKADYYFIPV